MLISTTGSLCLTGYGVSDEQSNSPSQKFHASPTAASRLRRTGLDQGTGHEQPTRSHLDQLHNEYAITRQLTDVAGVRPAYAKEGTESRPVLLLEYIQGHSLAELIRSPRSIWLRNCGWR